jgi:branched-chain amino acid aminotransferase
MECAQNYYIQNFKIKNCNQFNEDLFKDGTSIYEVIRIEKGIPLFLENHLNRLFHSADISGLNINESYCDFETLTEELIKRNQIFEGKIKIVIHYQANNRNEKNLLLYFTPHYFPTLTETREGVILGLCKAVRTNPNAKILNTIARQKANHYIVENKLFEVLLHDSDNRITEGSRSNIFFIKDQMILTPPGNEVLKGITRSNVFKLCKLNNISIIEKHIHLSDLPQMDAAFLSGTSIKVLPVKSIESIHYHVNNELLQNIMRLYNQLIADYVAEKTTPTN